MRRIVHDEAGDRAGTLALIIDGDNATPKIIAGLLAEIANYGTASVKRVYGDWTKPNLNGWKECLLEHSIQPVQQFAYTTGKNATDGAMIIDAMDLLYTGRFDGFCIVSSDSDFARLAARIREQGVTVYGFGERKTPRPFITACDKFVYFDVLNVSVEDLATAELAPTPGRAAVMKAAAKEIPVPATRPAPTTPVEPAAPQKSKIDKVLIGMLTKAVIATADEDGWVNLGAVGSHVAKQSPEFDSRNYGFARLSDLVEATGKFDIDRSGKTQKGVLIHLRPASNATKK
ncbi:NYN domain-containing protein [Rhizobium rhizogenes]|uniref:NYN domain-containing protein n=1 Tax=Rhizobium rhizogenes TaxID=359 RepID=UPI0015726D77|nr:NYN domain-containing protein [Rhizobium rhizogenes]NTH22788.1 NYN domain-containing protein [Rhizobium rhizogenes]NTH35839.1 NYN domain-containing protein [Rhizobium rhizogenes]